MKALIKICIVILAAGLWSCEKNDPLADQGKFTGNIMPFNSLSQMMSTKAGDTVLLRTVCWAVNDDIETVEFFQNGFKKRFFEASMSIEVNDTTIYHFHATFDEDTIFTPQSLIVSYPNEEYSLDHFFQTYDNAYVVTHKYVVPMEYEVIRKEDAALIMDLPDYVFEAYLDEFLPLFNRRIMLTVFPEINPFSVVFFKFDAQGNFTGELTDAAMDYLYENFSRELMGQYITEASVEDETPVTVESVATIEVTGASKSSERTFYVN